MRFSSGRRECRIGRVSCPSSRILRMNLPTIILGLVCFKLRMTELITSLRVNKVRLRNGKEDMQKWKEKFPISLSWNKKRQIYRTDLTIKSKRENRCNS